MTDKRFASKVDAWLMALCLAPLLIPMATALVGMPMGRTGGGLPVRPLIVAGLLILIVTTRYVVTDSTLTVWFGPIRRRRPLSDLRRLRASRSVESSPAWSLDRIEISTTRGFWLNVSPADNGGFVRAVLARAPQVQLDQALASLLR